MKHYLFYLTLTVAVLPPTVLCWVGADETQFARRLADPNRRQAAIAQILQHAKELEPTLLRWAEQAPRDIEAGDLYLGLIEAFGRLGTAKAIPFLIDHIELRFPPSVTGALTPKSMASEWPAVTALVRIGPQATMPLIQAYRRRQLRWEERLAVLAAVVELKDPRAEPFLLWVRTVAYEEITFAESGLASLGINVPTTNPPGEPKIK